MNVVTLNRPLYHQAAYSFISDKEGNWFLLQYMTDSSKGFNTIKSFEEDQAGFVIDICLEACDWWGHYGEIRLDTLHQTVSLIHMADA